MIDPTDPEITHRYNPETADELGKAAYDAYCETREWKSFRGEPLPQWPEVTQDIKAGWMAAAEAAVVKEKEICF